MFNPNHEDRLGPLDEQFPRASAPNSDPISAETPAIGVRLPEQRKRPDPAILSESIPLFFIGRNRAGFWVARDSEGRTGGVFLFKRSAISFAKRENMPGGCALMFVPEGLELDLTPKPD